MRFSPNTLNSIIAVLSVDGVAGITPDRLNAALQALLGEANTSPDLQPGETYLVHDKDNFEYLDFDTRQELDEWLNEAISDDYMRRNYCRDVDEYLTVYVIRREMKIKAEMTVELTFS